uniref:Uncharacterized protein n=1 Tax=Glossina pallidipes TaxID=7398 RepID=A0A1B0AA45_GLOPL
MSTNDMSIALSVYTTKHINNIWPMLFLCNTQSSNSLCTQPPEAFINNNSNSNSSSSSRLKTESEYLMHLHNLSCYACCKISQKQTKKKETNIPTAVKSAAITYLKRFSPKTVSIRVMRVQYLKIFQVMSEIMTLLMCLNEKPQQQQRRQQRQR